MMRTISSGRRRWALVAPFAVAAVFLATACSSSSPGGTSSPSGAQGSTDGDQSAAPEEKGQLKLAFSNAVPQVEKVPTILAAEELEDQGYDVELIWLQSSEDPVQAVVRGDAQIGSANVSSVFGAAAQGAPIKAIVTQNNPSYAMVAPVDVDSPEGLDGLRVGIHAQVSATALYSNLLLEDYPDVKPNYVVVPGSQNRIQALIGGELDASVIQLSDLRVLEEEAPGRFHVLYNYSEQMGDIIDSAVFTTDKFLESDPQVVQDFLKALLHQQELVQEDHQLLVDAIAANVPDTTPELAESFAQVYLDSNVWPADGNFTQAVIDRTVQAIAQYGGLETAPTAESCCTTEPLDEALGR